LQINKIDDEHLETFDEYVTFLDKKVNDLKTQGAVALKTVTPYYRGMDYIDVPEAEARRAFQTMHKPTVTQQKSVEDFAFHFIIRKAIEVKLPVQIHTGILAWNRVFLPHCNPVALNHLFLQYPECRFILFHGGFPFIGETGALVKAFPNVFLDFCWLPWISQSITKRCLHDWLDLIPYNKLMWGGDAHRAECVHGHWQIAQQVVIEVLSEKILDYRFSLKTAAQIIKGIFRNNAINIFHLDLPQE
jgi:predicted TIM-barrel fold metal-dependent hydrolase